MTSDLEPSECQGLHDISGCNNLLKNHQGLCVQPHLVSMGENLTEFDIGLTYKIAAEYNEGENV